MAYVIHAGDYTNPGIVQEFRNLKSAKLIGILGNNDAEKTEILASFLEINGTLKGELGELEIDGLSIALYHGTSTEILKKLIGSGKYDVLICGHTHKRQVRTVKVNGNGRKSMMIINPGPSHRRVKSVSDFFEEEAGVLILDTKDRSTKR